MKMLPDGQFWLSVLGSDIRHHSTSDFL